MRRFSKVEEEDKCSHELEDRRYHEHADESEAVACGKVHMRYDEEIDYGFFGEELQCVWRVRMKG
jgi:hypothetical protein